MTHCHVDGCIGRHSMETVSDCEDQDNQVDSETSGTQFSVAEYMSNRHRVPLVPTVVTSAWLKSRWGRSYMRELNDKLDTLHLSYVRYLFQQSTTDEAGYGNTGEQHGMGESSVDSGCRSLSTAGCYWYRVDGARKAGVNQSADGSVSSMQGYFTNSSKVVVPHMATPSDAPPSIAASSASVQTGAVALTFGRSDIHRIVID